MTFFEQAITILQTLVIVLDADLGIWGVINLLESRGNDNPGIRSQGMKQFTAGAGVAVVGMVLVPLLSGLFSVQASSYKILAAPAALRGWRKRGRHRMDFLLEALTNWLKETLVGDIMSNLSGMLDSVNQQVVGISVQVDQTPQGWNDSIFSMIESLSNPIMAPIAGAILAIAITVDLIQVVVGKSNLRDMDTWIIFKWMFKSAAAILVVTDAWNIVMGVFDTAQSVVAQMAGVIGSDASIDISLVMTDLEPRLMEMDLGPLLRLWF